MERELFEHGLAGLATKADNWEMMFYMRCRLSKRALCFFHEAKGICLSTSLFSK